MFDACKFTVGKNVAPLRDNSSNANITAGFYRFKDALNYAETQRDGLNFVLVFDENGRIVHIIGPASV